VTGFLDPPASDWMGRVVKEMRLGINSPGSQAPNQYFFWTDADRADKPHRLLQQWFAGGG
jgi:hypothetical protein